MVRKNTHPNELFDYVSGVLDDAARRPVEEHLAACSECSSVAEFVRAMKSEAQTEGSAIPGSSIEIPERESGVGEATSLTSHPDMSELASLVYGRLSPPRTRAASAHVALCRSCANELAEYARAERLAREYDAAAAQRMEIPPAAWELIREWEESSFAKPRAADDVVGLDLLTRFSKLLSERREQLNQVVRDASRPELVPVVVVSRSGEFRGVELFESSEGPGGSSILRHADKSERFDSRPVHVLLDVGEKEPVLVSERIEGDTIRFERPPLSGAQPRREGYFIIEE